jgi:hypothetical protein
VQRLGLDLEAYGELLAVVGLFNQFNKLADGLQIEPDVLPDPAWPARDAKPSEAANGPAERRRPGRKPPRRASH